MTILPHDRHLSIWNRAIGRLQALIDTFKDWRTDDDVRLPDWWKPKQAESSGRGSDG
jgi:ABC-type nitrate/sulfonate/bicarbonate transport system substrate-binding protein